MKHLKRWSAVYILVALFLGSWVGQFFTQLKEVRQDAHTHKEPFRWAEFWPQFWSSTFENWQSEFLQLAVQAILIASIFSVYFFGADHGADKDDIKKIMDRLDKIDPPQ